MFKRNNSQMKRFLSTICFLFMGAAAALAVAPAQATDSTLVKNTSPTFNIAFQGGYGRRLGKLPDTMSGYERTHAERLKNGLSLGVKLSAYMTPEIGVGFILDNYHCSSTDYVLATFENGTTAEGYNTDNIDILSVGPALFMRGQSKDGKLLFSANYALCFMYFRDRGIVINQEGMITGGNAGYIIDIGVDYFVAPKISVGLFANAAIGSIGRINVSNTTTGESQWITLDEDSRESLSHIGVGVSLAFHFK